MTLPDILGGFLTGGIGGLVSGFLGVTSGGILVPLLVLILGKDQHVAQGISLVAQIVPTSLSGVRNYSRSGHRVSVRWLIWLAGGFCVGGIVGALLAVHVSDRALQWTFSAYLALLIAIVVLRPPRAKSEGSADMPEYIPLHWSLLLVIGFVAGGSSGFLGIGGGLAITALMAGLVKIAQHCAQAMSLCRDRATGNPARCSVLCSARRRTALACDREPDCRPLDWNRYRRTFRQPRHSRQAADHDDRDDWRDGALHGVQGMAPIGRLTSRAARRRSG